MRRLCKGTTTAKLRRKSSRVKPWWMGGRVWQEKALFGKENMRGGDAGGTQMLFSTSGR